MNIAVLRIGSGYCPTTDITAKRMSDEVTGRPYRKGSIGYGLMSRDWGENVSKGKFSSKCCFCWYGPGAGRYRGGAGGCGARCQGVTLVMV